ERSAFFAALAADREPAPHYVLEAPAVFGAAGLRAALAPPPHSDQWKTAAATTPAATPLPAEKEKPAAAAQPAAPAASPAPKEKPRRPSTAPEVIDDDAHTRVRMSVPDPRAAMIERWIAGREGPSALLVDASVMAGA